MMNVRAGLLLLLFLNSIQLTTPFSAFANGVCLRDALTVLFPPSAWLDLHELHDLKAELNALNPKNFEDSNAYSIIVGQKKAAFDSLFSEKVREIQRALQNWSISAEKKAELWKLYNTDLSRLNPNWGQTTHMTPGGQYVFAGKGGGYVMVIDQKGTLYKGKTNGRFRMELLKGRLSDEGIKELALEPIPTVLKSP